MLSKKTLKFLSELKENNNREWFESNRLWYGDTKSDFEKYVLVLLKGIAHFDKDMSSHEVKHCTFRQYRDVRFSKDKRPYKINMGAYFNRGGKKQNTAGYYFHFEPGKSMMAAGLWMPEAAPLNKIRQEIDYNYDEWNNILKDKSLKKAFPAGISQTDTLKRPPKNYDEANPAIGHLKLKSFIISQPISDSDLLTPTFEKQIIKNYRTVFPFINFLNRALE